MSISNCVGKNLISQERGSNGDIFVVWITKRSDRIGASKFSIVNEFWLDSISSRCSTGWSGCVMWRFDDCFLERRTLPKTVVSPLITTSKIKGTAILCHFNYETIKRSSTSLQN